MRTIKKWLPFFVLLIIALSSAAYLVFAEQKSPYKPTTESPSIIYREACASCHGDRGQGRLLYPALTEENPDQAEIKEVIEQGELLMPAFEHIKKDTLDKLVRYILEKGYRTGN